MIKMTATTNPEFCWCFLSMWTKEQLIVQNSHKKKEEKKKRKKEEERKLKGDSLQNWMIRTVKIISGLEQNLSRKLLTKEHIYGSQVLKMHKHTYCHRPIIIPWCHGPNYSPCLQSQKGWTRTESINTTETIYNCWILHHHPLTLSVGFYTLGR